MLTLAGCNREQKFTTGFLGREPWADGSLQGAAFKEKLRQRELERRKIKLEKRSKLLEDTTAKEDAQTKRYVHICLLSLYIRHISCSSRVAFLLWQKG